MDTLDLVIANVILFVMTVLFLVRQKPEKA